MGEPFFTDSEREYADLVVSIVGPIVANLAKAFPPGSEVVLHNLAKIPNSIEVISESITGRSVGGPPTDLGLKTFQTEIDDDLIGYRTSTDSGLEMRSSSIFFRTSQGRAVVALCINTSIADLLRLQGYLQMMTGEGEQLTIRETFPSSVEMLAHGILREAISAAGVDVDLMKKSHKMDVVRELDKRGFFTLRESVDLVAKNLKVSRYSIYNYLNELGDGNEREGAGDDVDAVAT